MAVDSDLIQKVWAAINLETMLSRAWAGCFANEPDLKFDDYREIIFVVMTWNALRPEGCILSRVQSAITNSYNIDNKTVTARIMRLVDDGLFIIQSHPKDGRKKCVQPTQKLIQLFGNYNELVPKIVNDLGLQMSRVGVVEGGLALESSLRFDIFSKVIDDGCESPAKKNSPRAE